MKKTVIIEDDVDVIDYSTKPLVELQEIIDSLNDKTPKDKRKKEYKEHINLMNEVMKVYNTKVGEKIYRLIKL